MPHGSQVGTMLLRTPTGEAERLVTLYEPGLEKPPSADMVKLAGVFQKYHRQQLTERRA